MSAERTAVIAKRVDEGRADTEEIAALAESAGYEVVGTVTQTRAEDPGTNLGAGAIDRLAHLADERSVRTVVVDNDLTPGQAQALDERLPACSVRDRHRLILDIFEDRAGTRQAQLQVRLAELRYELPHLRARIRRDEATEITRHDEEGKPIEDHERRIDEVRRKLARIDDADADRHQRRREAGFDLVALAGYTNAGKSTLLRRLADDHAVGESTHGDLAESATAEDRLFETLGTTTRRATVGGRRMLVTDTIGFIRDLPGWLVPTFESTMGAVEHADSVCLVVDASDPPDEVCERVAASREHLADAERVLPIANKADRASDDHLDAVRDALSGFDAPPTVISATDGTGIGALRARLRDALPEARASFDLPNCGGTMAFVSWAYDRARVERVDYASERVTVEVAGHPTVIERARARAAELR